MQRFIDTISETLGRHLPGVLGAVLAIVVGVVLASLLRTGLARLLKRVRLDERLNERTGTDLQLSAFLASILFYFVILYAALVALSVLGVEGVLDPVRAMLTKALALIPNVVAAVLIGVIGYVVAKIVSAAVRVAASGLDRFASKAGLGEGGKISGLLGTVVFALVITPVLIAALDALQIKAISEPAIAMLQDMLAAVPRILGALIILAVAYVVGRFVTGVLTSILKNAGVDGWAEKAGAGQLFGSRGLSGGIGSVVLFFILLGAGLSAVETLGLERLSGLLSGLLTFAGQVVVGLLVIAVGVWLANVVYSRLHKDGKPTVPASIARVAVLGFVLSLGLRAMGIGDSIVNLAFGLTLGAVAVAVALSFGLGGREAAGRQLEHWLSKWRKED